MTAIDEREFVEFVRSTGDVQILSYTAPTVEPAEVQALPNRDIPFWGCQFLRNATVSGAPRMKFIERQGYFIPDVSESELIEFSRSFLDEGRLVRGRIWAEMNGWSQDSPFTTFKKSEQFIKWYDRLANWIKRHSTRNSMGDFMLHGAATFAAQGGQLCQAVLASGKAI